MIIAITETKLTQLLVNQLDNFLFIESEEQALIEENIGYVLNDIEYCFSKSKIKYYYKELDVFFNPMHSIQYLLFLLFFARKLSLIKQNSLADRLYYLNKILHSIDIYHEIELPKILFFEHPLGTVFGRAKYSDYLCVFQNCTIGGVMDRNTKQIDYPTIGRKVILYSGTSILGKSNIGDNVVFGANTMIKNQDVPSNSVVFGQSPNIIIKNIEENYSHSFNIW